jgi:hypothetical protein
MKIHGWLVVLTVLLCGATWQRWRAALPTSDANPTQMPAARPRTALIPAESLNVYQETITANDPFRLSNRPAVVRFDARGDVGVGGTPGPPVTTRPQLVVKGIVGGPPWQAIIDGLPGQPPGTIVTPGATFDQLVVRAVSRDSVIVQGPDTTWTLTLNRPKP